MNPFKGKKGVILILGLGILLFSLVFTGWTRYKFTDITLCMTCHELFVTNEDYQPVRDNEIKRPAVGFLKVGVGCAECHIYPYEEYKKSHHFENERGIKPGCLGCHKPHNFVQILRWKFMYPNPGGYRETPFYVLSNAIRDLPEWEGMKVNLAKRAREVMKRENSFRCKECHNPEITESKIPQGRLLKIKKHKKAMEKGAGNWEGLNCLSECHYNLVHASGLKPEKAEIKKEEE